MDIQSALEILEFSDVMISSITLKCLKKQYYKLSLQYHPDKNGNTPESTQHFQKISDAYTTLKHEIDNLEEAEPDDTKVYEYFVNLFVDGLINNEFNSAIIKNIIRNGYTTISRKIFDNLDKDQATTVYNFIFKYKSVLHVEDDLLAQIQDIILEKYKNVQIYILNPSINDLIENNIYKLDIDGEIYYVPLWHNEVYFDGPNDTEIIVKCIPDLPENMSIDEHNNLYITLPPVSFTFSLLKEESIVVLIGKKSVNIPICKLLCKTVQTFVFKQMGISKISETAGMIYNTDLQGDISVKITFS